jgi:hypothetical protein
MFISSVAVHFEFTRRRIIPPNIRLDQPDVTQTYHHIQMNWTLNISLIDEFMSIYNEN